MPSKCKPEYKLSIENDDGFVGIRIENNIPVVYFPHGFSIQKGNEKLLRNDTFRLLGILNSFKKNNTHGDGINSSCEKTSAFPLTSYQYLISDFLANGYYYKNETIYSNRNSGKISWRETIHTVKPQIVDDECLYLSFVSQKKSINENSLITLIHKYCVYECFMQFGWLYTELDLNLVKPSIQYNRELFLNILFDELNATFNDNKRKLFQSMINIIEHSHEDIGVKTKNIGVYNFESVWEQLIDYVFGINKDKKEEYFPKAEWVIIGDDNNPYISSSLEPDTIMKYNDKLYILDAKYYKYGLTNAVSDLPATSSIQKQITYARHALKVEKKKRNDEWNGNKNIYNAFVMPFNAEESTEKYKLKFVAVGKSGWDDENDDSNYMNILGLLLDTRHLITTFSRQNLTEIEHLSEIIEESIENIRNSI